jgi:hypothetical protein
MIWCLFSVDNNYDQPNNNLVCWWKDKPSIPELARILDSKMEKDNEIIAIVRIHQGENHRISNTDYRLEGTVSGIKL